MTNLRLLINIKQPHLTPNKEINFLQHVNMTFSLKLCCLHEYFWNNMHNKGNRKRSNSSLMHFVSLNLFRETTRGLKIPFKLHLEKREQSDKVSLLFFLQCELKPETRVPKSDLSFETGASLAIYLCGHEKKKKKTQSSFVVGQRLICCSEAP